MSKVDGFHVGFDGRVRQMGSGYNDWSEYGGQFNIVCAYDISMSTSVYGLFGVGNMGNIDAAGDRQRGSGASYGAGLWFNILDAEVSTLFETLNRIRVQSAIQYSRFDCRLSAWNEVSGNLTLGFVNAVDGNKTFWPMEMTLYLGPCMSAIWAADLENYSRSSDSFGGIVGIDLNFDKAVSFGGSVEIYPNGMAWTAGAMFRF